MPIKHQKQAKHKNANNGRAAQAIAAEAGRIMAQEGVTDFQQAKMKARDRLHFPKDTPLPANHEIQQARDDYLSLFTPEQQLQFRRIEMMHNAIDAMEFFHQFQPKLVAEFLLHPVSPQGKIELHLQATDPEALAHFLLHHQIPFTQKEKTVTFGINDSCQIPVFSFEGDGQQYSLSLFSHKQIRKSVKNRSGTAPLHRINVGEADKWLRRNTP